MTGIPTKYPHIRVTLHDTDGSLMAAISRVMFALRRNGVAEKEIASFVRDAMRGDLEMLLNLIHCWVTVTYDDNGENEL